MMTNKIYSMIGLAQKAGKVSSGDDTCETIIKSNKSFLVIVASDASDRTKKKFNDMCIYRNIKIYEFGLKDVLGKSIGKLTRSILVIKDINFANTIEKLLNEKINESGGDCIV